MGAEFNVNQALDQAKNFIKERLDKKSVKQATSIDVIIEEFFKDTSYDFKKPGGNSRLLVTEMKAVFISNL